MNIYMYVVSQVTKHDGILNVRWDQQDLSFSVSVMYNIFPV